MDSEVKKVFFIVNRFSGTGFRPEMEELFSSTCRERGWGMSLQFTQGPGHATRLAAEALQAGFSRVVAVGGDGTANEVAQALVRTPVAMGIVPKGSGNGLARHLGMPLNVMQALHCVLSAPVIPIDTFLLNGKLSINVSGIGFDGHIATLFAAERQRGFQGYARLALSEFRSFAEFEAEIGIGERKEIRNAFVIAIANSSQYGNNARIAPAASVSDGFLDVSVLKKFPPYRLDFIYAFFAGSIDQSSYCEILRVQNLTIALKMPVAFHIDGEPAGQSDRFTIGLLPASLRMIAPRTTGI